MTPLVQEEEQLSKLQKSVVSWLYKHVPTKKTKFAHQHVVSYFSAAKALDALMKVQIDRLLTLIRSLKNATWIKRKDFQ